MVFLFGARSRRQGDFGKNCASVQLRGDRYRVFGKEVEKASPCLLYTSRPTARPDGGLFLIAILAAPFRGGPEPLRTGLPEREGYEKRNEQGDFGDEWQKIVVQTTGLPVAVRVVRASNFGVPCGTKPA